MSGDDRQNSPSISRQNRPSATTDKIGLTIEEAADYTGIGRNTMRKLVEWEKIPVLRIGRRYIIRIDVIHKFMEANQGADLLVREQVRAVR